MSDKFNPENKIIKLCMLGINSEEKGNREEAIALFMQAFNESKNEYERFIATYQMAKHEKNISEKLNWL